MDTMLLNLLALWPLLLIQMPTVFMSDMSSSEGDFGNLAKRERDDESSDSLHEPPEERIRAQPNWLSFYMSIEETKRLLCDKLEETTLRLGLSLPKEELDPTKPLCGLQLNPQRTVDANTHKFVEKVFYSLAIRPKSIRKSETGNILILPFEDGREAPSIFSANRRRYVLRRGVAEIIDERHHRLAYTEFTANREGILVDGFNRVPFKTKKPDELFIKGLRNDCMLPNRITLLEEDGLSFKPKYLFYKDVGPLKAPYPIPHLGLSDQLLNDAKVRQTLRPAMVPWGIVGDAVGLIRLIQLWKELYPGYKGEHPDCTFENPDLGKLNKKLEALGDDATEGEAKELLLAASKVIFEPNAEGNGAGGIEEEDVHDEYPFLRVLMEKESKVRESFAIELSDHLVPKKTVGKDICDDLFGKLAFYRDGNLQIEEVPYEIEINCQGQPFAFRLIAGMTQYGSLFTYGTEWDCNEGEQIFKVTDHFYKLARITYWSVEDTKKVLVEGYEGFLIYEYVDDVIRWRRTKVAPPTD